MIAGSKFERRLRWLERQVTLLHLCLPQRLFWRWFIAEAARTMASAGPARRVEARRRPGLPAGSRPGAGSMRCWPGAA